MGLGKRRTYDDSCRELQRQGWIEDSPPLPTRRPRHDDDVLGVSFFRTLVEDADLSNMTLPRTFFGRSEIHRTSFRNADLAESVLCWNDFVDVDFSSCALARGDLRAASFRGVSFADADLQETDLRRSTFEACKFDGAGLRGAKLTVEQGRALELSAAQRSVIAWQDEDGDEPDGG
jgi:BTB/POZ domain-containing protein KCTD9